VVQSPVTKKFLVRDKVRADQAGILDDCRLEDVCFSCGVPECPQRPWVKQPHVPLDLERARASVPPPSYGRRSRRGHGAASMASGVDTATRFRILFEKGIEMRFTSHLDLMRTWERTLRRSGLPLSFTQGHHPHLKMSFGPPLPLGYRSRAEAFDLELTKPPAVDLAERLNAVLPEGLRVIACRPILFKSPSLMSQLEGASYRVRFPDAFLEEAGFSPVRFHEVLEARVADLLARDAVIVRRSGDGQTREFNARPSIAMLEVGAPEGGEVLDAHLRFTLRAQARPDDVVAQLFPEGDARTTDVERLALWTESGGRRLDPLALLNLGT